MLYNPCPWQSFIIPLSTVGSQTTDTPPYGNYPVLYGHRSGNNSKAGNSIDSSQPDVRSQVQKSSATRKATRNSIDSSQPDGRSQVQKSPTTRKATRNCIDSCQIRVILKSNLEINNNKTSNSIFPSPGWQKNIEPFIALRKPGGRLEVHVVP